jgi:GntR family transcriptional regulator
VARGGQLARNGDDRRYASWVEIEKAILFRIASDYYAPSLRLPTCEELGQELGFNKNTVSKAYRSLVERGYLRTIPGRGTFITKKPPRAGSAQALSDVHGLLALVLQEAKLAGLGHEQFLDLVGAAAAKGYERTRLRVGLVECNAYDAATLSRDLQEALSWPIEPVLLEDIARGVAAFLERFDVLAVNLAHLQELESLLHGVARAETADVVGLVVSPDAESLTQIVRLRKGTRVAMVCDLEASLQRMTGIVAGYNPGVRVSGCLAGNEPGLRKLLRNVDFIVATPSTYPRVLQHAPRVPTLRVTFQIEERSVQHLAERLGNSSSLNAASGGQAGSLVRPGAEALR